METEFCYKWEETVISLSLNCALKEQCTCGLKKNRQNKMIKLFLWPLPIASPPIAFI